MLGTLTAEQQKDLVYAEIDESLVFIRREHALELVALRETLDRCSSWRELRSSVSKERHDELAELCGHEESDPADGDEDDDDFPGSLEGLMADGDYPEWPAQEMLDWMPESVLDSEYASVDDSVHNGEYLLLDPEREAEILALLRAEGYQVTKDEALVSKAAGYR